MTRRVDTFVDRMVEITLPWLMVLQAILFVALLIVVAVKVILVVAS